jgi:hypothetical protein
MRLKAVMLPGLAATLAFPDLCSTGGVTPVGRRNSRGVASVNHANVHSIRQHFAHEMTAIL